MNKVYINCPYNKDYSEYLNAIPFTLLYCDYSPVLCENPSSGTARVQHICNIIKSTQYSIHDLSTFLDDKSHDYIIPKLNMPLELGMDLGYINFVKGVSKKKILVCVKDGIAFNKSLSDLGGHDIGEYNDNTDDLIGVLRTWLYKISAGNVQIISSHLQQKFKDFKGDYNIMHLDRGRTQKDIEDMPKLEIIKDIEAWIKGNKSI